MAAVVMESYSSAATNASIHRKFKNSFTEHLES